MRLFQYAGMAEEKTGSNCKCKKACPENGKTLLQNVFLQTDQVVVKALLYRSLKVRLSDKQMHPLSCYKGNTSLRVIFPNVQTQ